ncbi:MAG TPA: DinB family protein [Blastocatellia bacterium]|nr:DinB family protein [Blastocatellia bacterium]
MESSMLTDFTQLSLSDLLVETEAIATEAQRSFGQLNAQQLNWKPSAEAWSVAQCLAHLLAANHEMFAPLDEAMARTKPARLFERLPVLPGLSGKMMIKIVSPNFKQKLKAPTTARPATSAIDAQIVHRFVMQQSELAERINKLERLNAAQIVMTSPFVRWVTYSLLDACRLMVAHERRHLLQAQRVTKTPGFPGEI